MSNLPPLLMFRVDMYYEGSRDFWKPFKLIVFRPEAEVLTEVKTRNIPRYMPIFEKVSESCLAMFIVIDIADWIIIKETLGMDLKELVGF